MPSHAKTDKEILQCFEVMAELRTHLNKDEFLGIVREMEISGYKLAYIESGGVVAAVAGYRISKNLFMGKNLYVDDLVTASIHRSKGYGKVLISWLKDLACEQGCRFFHLDSGSQRHEAHKFYFRQGLKIASYHFSERLGDR